MRRIGYSCVMGFPRIDPNPLTNGQLPDTTVRLAHAIEHTCTDAGMSLVDVLNAMSDREGYNLTPVDVRNRLAALTQVGLVTQTGAPNVTYWWHTLAPATPAPAPAAGAMRETGVRIEWETDDIFRIFANGEEIADLCKDEFGAEGMRTLLDVVAQLGQHLDFPVITNGEPGV
jgi:hypothetical protein